VSRGVEPKAEIESNDKMSKMSKLSKNPSDDLPNQEKNPTELFFDGKQGLYIQKGDKETDQEK